MWALNKDIILTAQHIPGVSDTIAEHLSHLRHHGIIQTTVRGSVCTQIDISDTLLLQLETRPPGVSSECIQTGLGPTERLCQPTMMLNWQSYHAISKPKWCW